MKREFLINISLLLVINILVKPLYLIGVDAHIQNLVGPETYGVYFALFNLVFMMQVIIEPGIQSYNSKTIAQNPDSLGHHLPNILGIKSVLLVLFIGAVVAAFYLSGYSSDLLQLTIILAVNLFLSTTYIFLRTNIAAIGKYRWDSFLSALDKVLMLIILGTLSWLPSLRDQFTIMWLVYGQLAAYLISCAVAFTILLRHLGSLRLAISWSYFRTLIKASYPFILILLFMSLYNKMDGLMLERMLGDNGLEAGIYAAGYRLVDALNMLGYLMAGLLLPMYSSNVDNAGLIADLLYTGLRVMTVCAILGACVFIFFGADILPLIYDDTTPYYAEVLTVLMLSFVGVSVAYLYGTLLVAKGKLLHLNILLFTSVIINLLLNYYLIPIHYAVGAATATVITQGLVMLGQILIVHTVVQVPVQWLAYGKACLFAITAILVFYATAQLSHWHWISQVLAALCLCTVAAFITKLIDIKALLGLVKNRATNADNRN